MSVVLVTTGRRVPDGWGGYRVVLSRPKGRAPTAAELAALPQRFPDCRPEAMRKFAQQSGPAFRRPTVLVVRKVALVLDDLAFAGLFTVSRRWNVSHQEAARRLIMRAGGRERFALMQWGGGRVLYVSINSCG